MTALANGASACAANAASSAASMFVADGSRSAAESAGCVDRCGGPAGELQQLQVTTTGRFRGAHDVCDSPRRWLPAARSASDRPAPARAACCAGRATRLRAGTGKAPRAPSLAAPARSRSWSRSRSLGRCARVLAQSMPLTTERDHFPQQHEQSGHQQAAVPNRGGSARHSAHATSAVAAARSDGATLAEPAPRSTIAIASSKGLPSRLLEHQIHQQRELRTARGLRPRRNPRTSREPSRAPPA